MIDDELEHIADSIHQDPARPGSRTAKRRRAYRNYLARIHDRRNTRLVRQFTSARNRQPAPITLPNLRCLDEE